MNKVKLCVWCIGVVIAGVISSGCGLSAGTCTGYGFGFTLPGTIYSDQTRGMFILPKMQSMKDVEVLGPVQGKSSSMNILLIVSIGDCGIAAAKKDALLKYPEAEDIVNIEVDSKHEGILCLFNEQFTILRGIAIKYKK